MIKLTCKEKLYQWDTARFVEVDECPVVHFAWMGSNDNALVVEVHEDDGKHVAEIPNLLLQKPCNIEAWTFVDGNTVEHEVFKVNPRPKPDDYIYTPTEVESIESLKDWVTTQIAEMESETDYRNLAHKPSINERVLVGELSLADIGLVPIDDADIDKMFE